MEVSLYRKMLACEVFLIKLNFRATGYSKKGEEKKSNFISRKI
jgi:hypothetical protein